MQSLFFSFFLLSFSSLLLFILFFSFVIVFFRSYWTKKNRPWPFSTQMTAKMTLSEILDPQHGGICLRWKVSVAFTAIKREKFSIANQSLSKLRFLLFFFKVKFITNALLIYKTLLLKLALLSRYSVETRARSVFKEQKHIVWIKLWLHL